MLRTVLTAVIKIVPVIIELHSWDSRRQKDGVIATADIGAESVIELAVCPPLGPYKSLIDTQQEIGEKVVQIARAGVGGHFHT